MKMTQLSLKKFKKGFLVSDNFSFNYFFSPTYTELIWLQLKLSQYKKFFSWMNILFHFLYQRKMFTGAGIEFTRLKYGFNHLLAKFSNLDTLLLKFVVQLKLKFNWVSFLGTLFATQFLPLSNGGIDTKSTRVLWKRSRIS